ncbi:hypothetical protein OH77DRAFT_1428670 [Trametes cingulata]|nr:hypothetical protein OH77DRAFT_1428670 [Trametes cingulata]
MDECGRNVASGYLDKEFSLSIIRPGCEFSDLIRPAPNSKRPGYPKNEQVRSLEARLEQWHENAAVSGYGDVREQITKVNTDVRAAREIGPHEFRVEPELLRRVEAIWEGRFVPSTSVRAVPYKIHLYGPGDHFKMHRDTPQKDLVGTFLVGLGDTTWSGGLVVEGRESPAHCGHWCAFYPDVPHYVGRVNEGYRAVIAFKIFRASDAGVTMTEKTSTVRQQASRIMKAMEAPYGVLLQHKYCLGTDRFSGFDTVLVESARTLDAVVVRHLPVVIGASAEWGTHDEVHEPFAMSCTTWVIPFSGGYIEALQDPQPKYGWVGPTPTPTHTYCGCPWLEGVKGVPFFSLDLRASTVAYKEEQEETCNYVGNEAQAWREDSVYLSYALVVLPKAAPEASGGEA